MWRRWESRRKRRWNWYGQRWLKLGCLMSKSPNFGKKEWKESSGWWSRIFFFVSPFSLGACVCLCPGMRVGSERHETDRERESARERGRRREGGERDKKRTEGMNTEDWINTDDTPTERTSAGFRIHFEGLGPFPLSLTLIWSNRRPGNWNVTYFTLWQNCD